MKRFTLVLAISIGLLPGLVCKAEDGSVTGDTDYKSSHSSNSAVAVRQSANSAPEHAQARNHRSGRLTRDWRISYYAHANRLPWWPGAPGN
jgi:hypothetical protein